jgi:uncharacterized protein (DUF2252 family)
MIYSALPARSDGAGRGHMGTAGKRASFRRLVQQRLESGKQLRARVPRSCHADWIAPKDRPDPIESLKRSDGGRLAALLPIRYARMSQSPFAFLRGAADLMAADLAPTPVTGIRVQACGDCHVANFGGFGTPERQLVFDINDFDETLPAPWEWDLKRLAASIVVASRTRGLGERRCSDAARASVESYRKRMHEYAEMAALEVWYSHLDLEVLADKAATATARKRWLRIIRKAAHHTSGDEFPKITSIRQGVPRIADRPPLIYHPPGLARIDRRVRQMFQHYRSTLPHERRIVLDRYQLVDVARKVVGVGSVGTRCAVVLLMAGSHDPLLLQLKEARRSVLEPYAGRSKYDNQGERVVVGQRMLQSSSDVFLGWTRDDEGHDYYFRQLRDMKLKIDLESMAKTDWDEYVELCGWALARAHARTGDPVRIAAYLGKSESFEEAIESFAVAYADQTERDHAALRKAIRAGRIKVRAVASS